MEIEESTNDPIITVKSSEGLLFKTTLKAIKLSGTIKDMLDLTETEMIEEEIPMSNIDGITLEKVLKWIEYHKNEPQPTSEEIKDKTAESIDSWDERFLDIELDELYDLVIKTKSKKFISP